MADHAHTHSITKMSEVFQVSRSGYYSWLGRGPSRRASENGRLRKQIRQIWESSKRNYGSPPIYRQLKAEGWKVSRQRIARLMSKMGIAGRIRKKRGNSSVTSY